MLRLYKMNFLYNLLFGKSVKGKSEIEKELLPETPIISKVCPPPAIFKIGRDRSCFANYEIICDYIRENTNKTNNDFYIFLERDLRVIAKIDNDSKPCRLIFKSQIRPRDLERSIRKFIVTYRFKDKYEIV